MANKTIDDALADFAKDIRNGYAKEGKLQATKAVEALIIKELYDLHEYMGQFPDDLNLAVMHERIKLIEKERGK